LITAYIVTLLCRAARRSRAHKHSIPSSLTTGCSTRAPRPDPVLGITKPDDDPAGMMLEKRQSDRGQTNPSRTLESFELSHFKLRRVKSRRLDGGSRRSDAYQR
jgi:hypothetical protein